MSACTLGGPFPHAHEEPLVDERPRSRGRRRGTPRPPRRPRAPSLGRPAGRSSGGALGVCGPIPAGRSTSTCGSPAPMPSLGRAPDRSTGTRRQPGVARPSRPAPRGRSGAPRHVGAAHRRKTAPTARRAGSAGNTLASRARAPTRCRVAGRANPGPVAGPRVRGDSPAMGQRGERLEGHGGGAAAARIQARLSLTKGARVVLEAGDEWRGAWGWTAGRARRGEVGPSGRPPWGRMAMPLTAGKQGTRAPPARSCRDGPVREKSGGAPGLALRTVERPGPARHRAAAGPPYDRVAHDQPRLRVSSPPPCRRSASGPSPAAAGPPGAGGRHLPCRRRDRPPRGRSSRPPRGRPGDRRRDRRPIWSPGSGACATARCRSSRTSSTRRSSGRPSMPGPSTWWGVRCPWSLARLGAAARCGAGGGRPGRCRTVSGSTWRGARRA